MHSRSTHLQSWARYDFLLVVEGEVVFYRVRIEELALVSASAGFQTLFPGAVPGAHMADVLGPECWTLLKGEWRYLREARECTSLVDYQGRTLREHRGVESGGHAQVTLQEATWADRLLEPLDEAERRLLSILLGEGLPLLCKSSQLATRLRYSERHVRRILGALEGRGLIERVRAGRAGFWVHLCEQEEPLGTRELVRPRAIAQEDVGGDYDFGLLPSNRLDPFPLQPGRSYRLGRAPDCDLRPACSSVSRAHAELVFREGGWAVRDLGSTNGTFLNDRRLSAEACPSSEHRLSVSDALRFGQVTYLFTRCDSDSDSAELATTRLGRQRKGEE